ncbi:alpha-ketoglutarate dehydrogenase component 4 [Nomia melanderi]|uniref:alpha-ketoglutarate dehydrogenase component 4 n=1 Tax=Nomia melanderi TaxID=2448451 RepID=UPI0013046BA3|nr:28S ribosomal protein S36, mitochondrial [Nomia melanderi]XP_031847186.1 28S ribosomal protein S36, mitochondrial [Nomia melanderi]XP_031847187.1 28S ribosomal protein S36, mitochondrial [Nomia melanderi]
MMATKGWKVVKPHVPLIKFRKGGITRASAGATATSTAHSGATTQRSTSGATGPNVTVLPTIEDIYLPPRFQRRPIDEKEIAYINRGGPE